jgi:16S rRNA (cytosine1402-N4)-methyltransferase
MSAAPHISVLADEVIALLRPRDGGLYCDGTLGAGGHTRRLLEESAPTGRVIGIDRDESALALVRERLADAGDRLTLIHGSFGEMAEHLSALGIQKLDGVLLDLGVSSMQLDQSERGFSFSHDGPIDMRMDTSRGETALELLRRVDVHELAQILRDYGEERFSKRIARRLKEEVRNNALGSTVALADTISACIPAKARHNMRIHPATRTFQALRIAVNRELDQLATFLEAMPELLAPGGRCAIISFHSLEDRMVKRRFRELAKTSNLPPDLARQAGERVDPICIPITRKPIVADDAEIERNPRARSAKLRACEKVAA